MSSLLTNVGAMTALTTLRKVNASLMEAQDQISTGKRVATSKDNSSLWQIAATISSDAQGFEALSTSLSLSKATLGTARQGAENVVQQLSDMRDRIISATQPDASNASIQTEVNAMREAIVATIESAQVNGLNLLTGTDNGSFVVSINRDTPTSIAAPVAVTVANQGMLGAAGTTITNVFVDQLADASETTSDNPALSSIADTATGSLFLDQGFAVADGNTYEVSVGSYTFSYTASTGDDDLAVAYGLTAAINANSGTTGISAALTPAAGTNNSQIDITNNSGADLLVTGRGYTAGAGTLTGFDTVDVSTTSAAAAELQNIETWLNVAKNAAATMAAAELRIEIQDEAIKSLTDSLKKGAGGITDADMEAAAARLQALQVQQQLGVQALSIANQQPQTILSLFQ